MELVPDTSNVLFMDEYPHLVARQEVKRALGQLTLFANHPENQIILFPDKEDTPDDAA